MTLWARRYSGDVPDFKSVSTFMAFGVRGSGKSTLLENLGLSYLDNGLAILDLYGSRDGESLAWLRSPEVVEQDKKVLLLHGSNTSVASCHDSKPITDFRLSDLNHYDLLISSGPLYSSIDVEYSELNHVLDSCYNRHTYKRIAYMVIREAANLIYSRMKISRDQTLVKGMLTYFVREMRHSGFALGIDTQKITSIDIDVRISMDYLFIKSLGYTGLPDELRFLYSIYRPYKLQNMRPGQFVVLTRQGGTGVGWFPYHKWHKRPGEDILKKVGIDVEHGEELKPSKDDGQVGDLEHVKIMELTLEGLSLRKVGAATGRNHQTVARHLQEHNRYAVKSDGCPRCSRAKSPLAKQIVEKP